jgi:hypothetical protein
VRGGAHNRAMAQTAEGNALTPKERARMCTSKKRFVKEGLAIAFVVRCRQRGVFSDGRVYRCQVCAGYHVTSQGPMRSLLASNV